MSQNVNINTDLALRRVQTFDNINHNNNNFYNMNQNGNFINNMNNNTNVIYNNFENNHLANSAQNKNNMIINNMQNLNINNFNINNNPNIQQKLEEKDPHIDYEELCNLGEGHFASVKKVRDKKTGNIYALKEITITGKKIDILHIKRETELPLQFNHKNMIKYYKSFYYKEKCYILEEFFKSKTLYDLLLPMKNQNRNNQQHFPQDFIIHIFRQLFEGLVFLHQKNIAHRDIKPDNILINDNNEIKYTDFGLAAYLEGEDKGDLLGGKTQVGTRSYGPPEIVFYKSYNSIDVDVSCDIFSLGYTMFELMNFELPTKTTGEKRELVRKNNEDRFYNPYLAKLVDQMYEAEKSKRPTAKQCLDFLNEIDAIIKGYSNNFNYNINYNMNTFNIYFHFYYDMIMNLEAKYISFKEKIKKNKKNKNNIVVKNTKLLSSMKCLLSFFNQINDSLSGIVKQIGNNTTKVRNTKNDCDLFCDYFCFIIQKVSLKQTNLIDDKEYNDFVGDFIIKIFNTQGTMQTGTGPIILFYNILTIINNEYLSLDIQYQQSCFTKYLIYQNFNSTLWPKMFKMINEYQQKCKNPMFNYFCFLIFSVIKCGRCGNILDIKFGDENIAYFLQFNVNSINNDCSLFQLTNNYFSFNNTNGLLFCNYCGCNNNVLQQKYMMNSPYYLVYELVDQYNIYFETKIDINGFKATNEGPCEYELISVIIYNPKKAEYEIKSSPIGDFSWQNIGKMSFNNPSMAIYKQINKN